MIFTLRLFSRALVIAIIHGGIWAIASTLGLNIEVWIVAGAVAFCVHLGAHA